MQQRILVIEDERDVGEAVVEGLRDAGFIAELVTNGRAALHQAQGNWDAIILDLMLPDIGGEAVLSNLRQRPDYPAVLVVTARAAIDDKVVLFREGCDDYLVKPFAFDELLARVKALLRRPPRVRPASLSTHDLVLDDATHVVSLAGKRVDLSPKEAAILRVLLENGERIVSRKELLARVWGLAKEPSANYLGVHLFHLRKKLAELRREDWLKTIKYSGYVFAPPDGDTHEVDSREA